MILDFQHLLNRLNRVNHWLVLITFLQHTNLLLPHYRSEEFTFPCSVLATLGRTLLGDLGSFMGWIGSTVTHGISETHVAHHVSSKIPHYNVCVALTVIPSSLTYEQPTAGRHLLP
jgi:omega-6 fatty acid desaturase (delta-12 desaturase)